MFSLISLKPNQPLQGMLLYLDRRYWMLKCAPSLPVPVVSMSWGEEGFRICPSPTGNAEALAGWEPGQRVSGYHVFHLAH